MADQKTLQDYQEFADYTLELLRKDVTWKETYAGYAGKMLQNRETFAEKRKLLSSAKRLDPLHCYAPIGAITGNLGYDFDLRFLGQSVGTIKVKDGKPILQVSDQKGVSNRKYFGCDVGPIDGEVWNAGEKARAFKAFFDDAIGQPDMMPLVKEHMVESALLSELGKEQGTGKALKGIQPITYVDDVRLPMTTAVSASDVSTSDAALPTVSEKKGGGIDAFCRRSGRLTVIEIKDENKNREPFDRVIKQAIAYAVFIRKLARSESGRDWMELWGFSPKSKRLDYALTINAAVAMPKGETTRFPFAGCKLELKGEQPGDPTDWIELHYIAFLGDGRPRDGQDVRFETSL